MKLDIKAMALTWAIIGGLIMFLCTWWLILMDGPSNNPVFLSKIYRGYSVTPCGSFIGVLWAGIDGAVSGACFAWIYNQFIEKKAKGSGGSNE